MVLEKLMRLTRKGFTIQASPYISDYTRIKRPWYKRLFSNFRATHTVVYEPKAYVHNGTMVLVSYQTYAKLVKSEYGSI